MERYIAFLRGINVAGQKLIKMEALRNSFTEVGFTGVKTYIQSGNVVFDADAEDPEPLIQRIEALIDKSFGFHTDVILRKNSDIEFILNTMESLKSSPEEDNKQYITFLKTAYSGQLTIPLFSKNKDVEIIFHNNKDFISVSNMHKGKYGFPNAFIEKNTGIPTTTRNPATLSKLLGM